MKVQGIARVIICVLATLSVIYGVVALVGFFVPTFGTDGEQPALTPTETLLHALAAFAYALVLLVPRRLLRQRVIYLIAFGLRTLALAVFAYFAVAIRWTQIPDFATASIVAAAVLFICVAGIFSIWELLGRESRVI